jgi:hypothetical protein
MAGSIGLGSIRCYGCSRFGHVTCPHGTVLWLGLSGINALTTKAKLKQLQDNIFSHEPFDLNQFLMKLYFSHATQQLSGAGSKSSHSACDFDRAISHIAVPV